MTNKPSGQDADLETLQRYQRLLARYERLIDISRRLSATLDIRRLLDTIIAAATELTDTEVASILLLDPHTGELRFEAGLTPQGASVSLESIAVPIEGSIAGWIVKHGEPVLIDDVRHHPRFFKHVDDVLDTPLFSTRNLLGVPLRVHNRVIGALEALNKPEGMAFTEEDVDTLTTLAAQAAVAIENTRLFQQNDFISEMVHELRTPLAALAATAHILLRPDLDEGRRHDLTHTIKEETDRLSQLISNFLDLARLESGRSRLEKRPFALGKLIHETVQVIQPQAAQSLVSISVDVAPDLPPLMADAAKLKQVLLNLLSNAVKYNRPNGEVRVRAAVDAERTAVYVSLEDTGRGIAEVDQPHVFDRFFRGSDAEGYARGSGLGLVIAKRIVEAHGGHIWLESEPGVGSTFYFTIPLA